MTAAAEGFAHLHVASGFSLRYGASQPEALVERAAAHGQPAVALTDRDGLYGAVRFVQAASRAGLGAVLGVDLAIDRTALGRPLVPQAGSPQVRTRTPVRGGQLVDLRLPRVTVLARRADLPEGMGWAALCRLVTDTHLRGERSRPVSAPEVIARRVRGEVGGHREGPGGSGHDLDPRLVVLLGPDSDVGRAVLARRDAEARALLRGWRELLGPRAVRVEVVCHGGPAGTPASRAHAARLLGLADDEGVPAVLTAAVRHADRGQARTVDVLDAARRLVPLDERHLDRVTDAGHLADSVTMRETARQVTGDHARADLLLAETAALAGECTQDPRRDLGIGAVHLPEPGVLGIPQGVDPHAVLEQRCRATVLTRYPDARASELAAVEARLTDELEVIRRLGYPTYFLTVAQVVDIIRDMDVRVAARGSGAGSLVNHLLGISGVDPMRYDLLMERFCTPLRAQLPDIDIDVESARRTDIYEAVLEHFGGERVTCVSMMDTYRVRHAVRDAGAALGMPAVEIDEIAKAFPHIRARDARQAIDDLPELRARGLSAPRLQTLFDIVEQLDGLPRHVALHPCGVVLSHSGLLDRTPVEASWLGFPMSQFDKDDVETLGLLKLDILGIRMQSAMAHAVAEVERVDGRRVDLDDPAQVPLDDPDTFAMIRTTRTLGCFQIESPGQRELIGKFGPERFEDLIIDISLFRPGPVKSDMITPFLNARHGWSSAEYLHPTLVPALQETEGVVVFHEQVLRIVAETTGVSLAEADEVRRAMGTPDGQARIEGWWRPAAAARGYRAEDRDRIWEVLRAFASFGFCKAHAAAFALPTYHSAWLKTHHPAAFLAGVLTHDPGMYPKRLILDDARSLGIAVLGLDINRSDGTYRVERLDEQSAVVLPATTGSGRRPPLDPGSDSNPGPDLDPGPGRDLDRRGSGYGIRLSLAEVKGISEAEVARIVAGQPYRSLADVWQRAMPSRPVAERITLAGGFDALHGIGGSAQPGRRGRITRRDILLHIAELDRWSRATTRAGRRVSPPGRGTRSAGGNAGVDDARPRDTHEARVPGRSVVGEITGAQTVRQAAAAQSQAARRVPAVQATQLALDLGDQPELTAGTGLPELTGTERVQAELEVLGLDASAHVVDFYAPMLRALEVTRSRDLLQARSRSSVLVCGVKVATQTPPVRSGRRVVFLTLDDSTGPVDATFFEDVQGPYASTVFHSWLLLVRGVVRRTGRRGVSLRATGAWELSELWDAWTDGGLDAVHAALAAADQHARELDAAARAATEAAAHETEAPGGQNDSTAEDGVRRRRVLVHASGFRQSPYADIRPAGGSPQDGRALGAGGAVPGGMPPRKLWHASPGSSGH